MVAPRRLPSKRQVSSVRNRAVILGVIAISFSALLLLRHEDLVQHQSLVDKFPSSSQSSNKKKIAIVVGGSFQRFILNSTLYHVMTPLVEQEHYQVDYFLLLTTSAAPPAYRADLQYMNHLKWDPIFGRDQLPSQDEIGTRIRSLVEETGANLRSLRLLDSMNVTDARLERKREKAREQFPNEDVDLRFPMKDLRTNAMQRTANGNRNILRLFFGIQVLWDDLVKAEETMKSKYDHVMIFRDDTLWLQDFSMDKLLLDDSKADAYVLSCDARVPPMLAPEINDHAIVLKREKAHVLGRYYTSLLDADLDACAESVKDVMGKLRGCNSEMILRWILQQNSINVQEVPQSLIPFQRSVHVQREGNVIPCFHKFCQSKEAPLIADPALQTCKALTWEERG